MDRGAWRATVHRLPKSQIQLKRLSTMNFKMVKKINVMLLFFFLITMKTMGKKPMEELEL